jgi:HEAT repeat protein
LLRERIITTVAEAGGAENTQFLRRVVATALEPVHLRERALRALAHSGLAATELIALYDSLPDRTLRARTINLLAERGGEAAFEKLGRIARDDPNPDLRRQAARRLAQSRDPRAQAFFERTLKN